MKINNRYKRYRTRTYKNCLISGYLQKTERSELLPFHVSYKVDRVITDDRKDRIVRELREYFAAYEIVIMNIKELG